MVFDKIKDIIVEQLDVEEDAVTMEASITEDLGADSLDVASRRALMWRSLMKRSRTSRLLAISLSISRTRSRNNL